MGEILKNSCIYKILNKFLTWIGKLFNESFLINLFLKESNSKKVEEDSFFYKVISKIIIFIQKIANKLKIDKLFENSIFAKPIIWLSITIFCVPFVPTMIALGMVICTTLSLILKIMITKDFELKYSKMNVWILLLVLIICISAFTSISKEESRNIALLMGAFTLFYFVVINTIENKKQYKFILYLCVISAVLTAIMGLYQYIFGDVYSQAWLDSNMFEDIKMRVYSTFENPNVYGEYLLLMIPIMMSLLWTEKGVFKKIVLFAFFGISMLALILTFSRGCWLAIIFSIGLLMIIIDKRFVFLGFLLLLILPFVLPETIINRFMSIGNLSDSSTSYRVYIWMGTLAMLKDYWFCGVGLGESSFNTIYPLYSYASIQTPHSHNTYLQLVSQFGIVGLIVFLGIIYNFYKTTTISAVKKKNIILVGFIASMTGFLIEGMFDYTWYNYRVILIFWIVIALGMLGAKFNQVEERKE